VPVVSVVAVSMFRDEVDVAARVVRWLLAEDVAHVVVADNGSRDGTRDALADLARSDPVTVIDDPEPAFAQGAKMTAWCAAAAERHRARWVLPFDADELWTLPRRLPRFGARVLATGILDHVCTGLDDPTDDNPFTRMAWRRPEPQSQKVLVRWRPGTSLEHGNHWALDRRGRRIPVAPHEGLALHHFQIRSAAHFHRKASNGKRSLDLAGSRISDEVATHWRAWGEIAARGEDASREEFLRRHFVADPRGVLVHDPVRGFPLEPVGRSVPAARGS
jgi:glycosyltransferase involved in cell wall biosynthesis